LLSEQYSILGLGVALLGAPGALVLTKRIGLQPLSWTVRLLLWGVAVISVALAVVRHGGLQQALISIGLVNLSGASAAWGLGGGAAIFLAVGLSMAGLRALGLPFGDRTMFEDLIRRPFAQRLFVVFTAAVVEEVLYRGSALSLGMAIWNDSVLAAFVAIAAFTLAHFRWRATHLINVAVAGSLLTALYLQTGDLFACIIAHFVVDAASFLVAPALMRRQTAQL